jgi:precorrin-2 dehydrogenase / sirohydrochlorin ferrochelatase
MISTNGAAPKLANLIRLHIAESLPANAGRGCQNVGRLRRKLRAMAPGPAEGPKRMKWYVLVAGGEADYRMVDVCAKYSLEELVQLDDEDMVKLLGYYKAGVVPSYRDLRGEETYTFEGSFGWHC